MGFNSGFKGLIVRPTVDVMSIFYFQEDTQGHRNSWSSAENSIVKMSGYSVLQCSFRVISFVVLVK